MARDLVQGSDAIVGAQVRRLTLIHCACADWCSHGGRDIGTKYFSSITMPFGKTWDIAGAKFKMLGDIGRGAANHKVGLAIAVVFFVDLHATRFTGRFGIGVNRQIFILDFDELHRRLGDVFVLGGHCRHRLSDIAHFALRQERLVFAASRGQGRIAPVTTAQRRAALGFSVWM